MTHRFVSVVLSCLALTCVSKGQDGNGVMAFPQLKALVGDWEGTYKWTGARTEGGSLNATYYLTGNGSALIENLIMEGVPSMTSVYHLDGADLRMTHYCGAQNQPRLKAERIDLAHGVINFAFVDATNLQTPDASHVHGMEMRLIDSNHLTVTFLFQSGSKESRKQIVLKPVEKKASKRGNDGSGPSASPCLPT